MITFGMAIAEQPADFADDEKKLIRSLRAMDEAAITWVWQTYYPALIRYATRMTNDANLADEIVSIVFEKLIRSFHQGKGPKRNVKSYLYRMAYNAIVDESRVLNRFSGMDADSLVSPDSPSLTLDRSNQTDRIIAALDQLTPDQRDCLLLRFVEGLTMRETAEVMTKTINSIKTLQGRALRRLRKTPEFQAMKN